MSASDHGMARRGTRRSSRRFIGVSRVTIRVGGANAIKIRCRCGDAVVAIGRCVSRYRRDLRVGSAAPGLPFQQEGSFVRRVISPGQIYLCCRERIGTERARRSRTARNLNRIGSTADRAGCPACASCDRLDRGGRAYQNRTRIQRRRSRRIAPVGRVIDLSAGAGIGNGDGLCAGVRAGCRTECRRGSLWRELSASTERPRDVAR